MNNQRLSDNISINVFHISYIQTVGTDRHPWWCQIARSTYRTYSPSGLLTFTYMSNLLWTEGELGAARWVEIIQHIRTPVQNHATMLWSLQHIRIMGINTQWQKKKLHNWGDAISPHANWCIFKTNKKNTAMGWRGRDVKKNKQKKQGTEPRKQTCNLHLTRSRGTTAVCVVPQLRIPPKPHRRKYFWEPNSQLISSEETQVKL